MEANVRGKAHQLKAVGKRNMEWDLNDWKWDGDSFSATPLNPIPSDCYGRQLLNPGPLSCHGENGKTTLKNGLEKRRRDIVVINDQELLGGSSSNEAESLDLKLGGQVYPVTTDMKSGKKSKVVEVTASANRALCQVDDCKGDLVCAKDYHRRHKVCEFHSKASRALVRNVMQRFCQQCSRFHVLDEFDEGKRSCRRRLAGHNRRRRKTHPENVVNSGPLIDGSSSSYLLVSLLRILANMQANNSDQTKDQDFISHLLKNLAGSNNGRDVSAPLNNGQNSHNAGTSTQVREKEPLNLNLDQSNLTITEKRTRLNDIDLNNAYDDSQDNEENQGYQKPSLPQTSGNSGTLSSLSPSSSSGEAQSRTDRIVFKLFGKDPSDLPLSLRKQIFDWLSSTPTDIESYIRPGCIILTIYLRLGKSTWEEICCNLSSSLTKHLEASDDPLWKVGWVYARVLHHFAFIHDGRVVLDTMLPLKRQNNCNIISIKPLAVSVSKRAQFSVKGYNLSQSTTRLLCALEGKYLVQETCSDDVGEPNISGDKIEIQCLRFSCSIPKVIGRGFIEVEDQSLDSTFLPFIVAEQDICTEICTLETTLEITETPNHQPLESDTKIKAREDALEFVHEIGWLLHRTRLTNKHILNEPNSVFSFERFSWLMEYSIERDWCAVVNKLLEIVFSGMVTAGDYSSVELALLDMGLVHRAVRRNCRSMVENLLKYVPVSGKFSGEKRRLRFVFRPDDVGPGGLTPLHVAASKEGSEDVLDALTDDPGLVGIEAWKSAKDNTGMTPNDYATIRGYYFYTNLVQKKIDEISSTKGHVVLDIDRPNKSTRFASFNTEKNETKQTYERNNCKICEKKMAYGKATSSVGIYRPAMLSMLVIAAVCVCAALLFKSSPKVVYVFEPFRWERLDYGSI